MNNNIKKVQLAVVEVGDGQSSNGHPRTRFINIGKLFTYHNGRTFLHLDVSPLGDTPILFMNKAEYKEKRH